MKEGLFLKRAEINIPPQQLPALTLAYVGDAVYELYVRNSILKQSHKVHTLHRLAINRVNNNTQSDLLAKVEGELTEEELAVVHRGRNAKGAQVPKNASPQIYRRSSGLEALVGYLYLSEQDERLEWLLSQIEDVVKK